MPKGKNVLNFGAGPAKLPPEVLLEVQQELIDFDSTGVSIMEISHRSSNYSKMNMETTQNIKELLNVPDNYKILLLQGGGTGMFSAVPANIMSRTGVADYAVTGLWSAYGAREAEKYGKVNLVFPKLEKGESIPNMSEWHFSKDASYVYYCDNETVAGIEYPFVPETNGVPLVCDMSSNILTRPVDVSKYGIIFAGAQKNIGTAGVTLAIVRDDLLNTPIIQCPTILDFTKLAKADSILNTPPTFSVYVLGKVLKWIKKQGGAERMQELSEAKSRLVYDVIDNSNEFYLSDVPVEVRSRMNVTFRCKAGPEMDAKFLKAAEELNMIQLKGHRSVGGLRASLYNAVTIDEVKQLTEFMVKFREQNI